MRILNFRAGFATNSSSSHSVVLLPPHLIGKVRPRDPQGSNNLDNFGWDYFRLTSEESKLRYLAAQFFMNYSRDKDAIADVVSKIDTEVHGYADEVAEVLYNLENKKENEWIEIPNVDHQSVFHLSKEYNPDFVSDMIRFFSSPRVVILGGNDNDDRDNSIEGANPVEFLNSIRYSDRGYRSRRDGDVWTLFNTSDGTKVRFCFSQDDLNPVDYVKSTKPELVDCKITNYCTQTRCREWCYMSSNEKGIHAPFDRIESIAKMLGEMQVFEVAIGGGEPTTHPDFAKILYTFSENGVTPNFTTLSGKWLNDKNIVKAVLKTVGGIGVSCLDINGLSLVKKIQENLKGHNMPTVSAQHVIGSVPIMQTVDFIKGAFAEHIPVLLLGFKEVGFGEKFERFDDKSLETFIKLAIGDNDNYWVKLSVDTALVEQYPKLTSALGVPNALVTGKEGAFSCYIDAVTDRCAASSYVKPHEMKPMPKTSEDFLKLFATF